jgi:hypothetical protein
MIWSWSRASILLGIGASIGLSAVASLFARRVMLRLPVEVFSNDLPKPTLRKNAVGLAVVALGVLLLFLPGPGIVLIVVGLLSSEFPGRTSLLRSLLKTPRVLDEVNAMRLRHGVAPIAALAKAKSL